MPAAGRPRQIPKAAADHGQVLAELFDRLLGTGVRPPLPGCAPGGPGSATVEEVVVTALEDAVQRMLAQEDLARFVHSLPVRHQFPAATGGPHHTSGVRPGHHLPKQGVHRGEDIPVDLLARHVLTALETAMRDWAESRVDDPMQHVSAMLRVSSTA